VAKIKRHKAFLKDFANTKLTDGQFEKFAHYVTLLKEDKNYRRSQKTTPLKAVGLTLRAWSLGGDVGSCARKYENMCQVFNLHFYGFA